MKKFATLALALAATSAASAQDANGLKIGIRGGATLAKLVGRDAKMINGVENNDLDYKLGFNAGLSFQIPISSDGFWSIAPEILVNRKGFEYSYEVKGDQTRLNAIQASSGMTAPTGALLEKYGYENRRVLTYIDVPIPVRANAGALYFELGPQVGYMARSSQDIKQTYKYNNDQTERSREDVSDAKEDLASFDIGLLAGVGIQAKNGFSFGVRYNQGVKTLFDSKNTSASSEQRAFNTCFMAQVGYLLPIGNK